MEPPIWLRGEFTLVRSGDAFALVRRDFLSAFERHGLAAAAGPAPVRAPASAALEPPGGRGGVFAVDAGPLGEAIVRPYRRGGLPRRLSPDRYLLGNRGFRELAITERLRRDGVPVPEPLAAVRAPRFPGYGALLVTRRIPGARAAAGALRDAASPGVAPILRRLGRATRLLHAAGAWHADLNAHNLLLRPEPGSPAVVVDLDRARLLPPPLPGPLARRNLARLRRSLAKLGLREALAAWDAFRDGYDRTGGTRRGYCSS